MKWEMFWERFLSVVKYLLGGITILAGFMTATNPITPLDGALGWLYSSRPSLVLLGSFAIVFGSYLIWAKIKKYKKHTGRALMLLYMLYTFAALLQMIATGFLAGIPNLVVAVIFGLLFLRWRFKTSYIDPKHFVDTVEPLRTDLPRRRS
jgi:hypothetical protein